MKKIIFSLFSMAFSIVLFSQTAPPQGVNYQAIVYAPYGNQQVGVNSSGQHPANTKQVLVKFTLEEGNNGPVIYEETHTDTTDQYGLLNTVIGTGTPTANSPGLFNQIDWSLGDPYLRVSITLTQYNSTVSSYQKLWSVPYALYTGHANTADFATNIAHADSSNYTDMAGNGITGVTDNGDGTLTFTYYDGSSYTTGVLSGLVGTAGPQGPAGQNGTNGQSAYDIWLAQGNTGTQQDFLNSLQGTQGNTGATGNGISSITYLNDSLIIYFSNGNDTSISLGLNQSNSINIGDYYQGGYVFYINPSGNGGLVVMPKDLMNYSSNTTWSDAISVCNNVKCNGYTDWYLPSLSELQLIYNNLGNAGFMEEYWSTSTAANIRWYWSSTPVNGTASYGVNFTTGASGTWMNNNDLRIRGIRTVSF